MFCREQAARLGKRRSDIEAAGARLIAIGNGHAGWARDFIEKEGVDFPVYIDPGRRSYDHFGMRRGATEVFNPRALANSVRALSQGFIQTRTKGDGFQNGGIVVIGPDGDVLYTHIEQESGDLADLDEVVAVLAEGQGGDA